MPPESTYAAERLVATMQGDEHESGERRADAVRPSLLADDPYQPAADRVERKSQQLLQPGHPGAGLWQQTAPRRNEREKQVRQGQPEPERLEDE